MGQLLELQSLAKVAPVGEECDQAAKVDPEKRPQHDHGEELVLGERPLGELR